MRLIVLGKHRLRRWALDIVLMVLVVAGVYVWTQWRGASDVATPATLPVLTLQKLDGQWVRYHPGANQVTLINFWSTDCPPCIAEIPALNWLQQWFGGAGFTVLGVAVAGNTPQAIAAARARFAMDYPLYADKNGAAAQILGGVTLTPTSLLINPKGQIVGRYVGAISLPVVVWRLLWMSHH
jgi:thiol-disulfide isomerase/thioredoxin